MVTTTNLALDVLSKFKDYQGHERIVHVRDDASGLDAYIGIHNRNCGPALGGCRARPYASADEAITDVLRLSRGMTYKNALAGLPLGGGKSVIVMAPRKTDAMIEAMGQAIEALRGHYITAEDSGTGEHDMELMHRHTDYVCGIPEQGKDALGGNPSPVTAWGVYSGIKAAVEYRTGKTSLEGLTVSVQGLGAVGYALCQYLYKDGVKIYATDIRADILAKANAEFPGLEIVGGDAIFNVPADVFAPCALGAQINARTIPMLSARIIAGAANNQLETLQDAQTLMDRDITYVPDYVINAGGVIAVAYEYFNRRGERISEHPMTREGMMAHVGHIGPMVKKVLELGEQQCCTTAEAADRLAEKIFMSSKSMQPAA